MTEKRGIPDGWATRSVVDLCLQVTSGGTPSRAIPKNFEPATVPWVKTGDLQDRYVTGYDEYISEAGVASSSAKLLPGGTVLMAMYGATVGRLGILAEPATCNQAACALIVDPDVCANRWLFYALLNDRERIVNRANGAAQQNLSGGTIKQLTYLAPSYLEQRAIGEMLGSLDDKIASNTNLAETASRLAVALLADRSPSVALADVVVHQKRSLAPADFGSGLVAHYSLPAFDTGMQPLMTAPLEIKSLKFSIEQPCVLVSKLNPRFPRIWDVVELPKALAVSSTEFLVLESDYCASTVLWAILSQPSFSAELESKVAGTTGSHQRVRPDDLLATHIIDPRLLADETKVQLESLGRRIALSRDESTALEAMRDALLPQLMSGMVRVKDAEQMVGEVV